MPRSPLQSDFVIQAPAVEDVIMGIATGPEPELPANAAIVKLPRAVLQSNEASARSTKIVMTFTWVMLAILALICAIGPHIPSGE